MASTTELLTEIQQDFRDTAGWTGRSSPSARVLAALERVPRQEFVPEQERAYAHVNMPLPIGHQQTISQPYIVAIMTELLELDPAHRVLEIGTGSGYQAAVLAEIADRVFSVETIPELAARAAATLQRLGYNVEVRTGDGGDGWPEHAPYDAIIVTAAASEVPQALVAQLKPGGRMVIPIGWPHDRQDLRLIEKSASGEISERTVLPVAFVPLVHSKFPSPLAGEGQGGG